MTVSTDSQEQAHIMLVAGEASGDMHAANMVRALQQLRPGLRFTGMGGAAMQDAGVDLVVDARSMGVVGLWEVLAQYRQIRAALNRLKQWLSANPPDLLVLVDYVEFNLRLAAFAKAAGIPVLFYVSPQIWAWRSGRVRRIGQLVDAMAVLFPFEVEVYRQHGIPVRYVGNPLVDVVRVDGDRREICQRLGLDPDRPILGLLPGSRNSELRNHLPIVLATARRLRAMYPGLQFALPLPPGRELSQEQTAMIDGDPDIRIFRGRTYEVMAASRALVVASGTATLEAALLQTPMAIIYRVSALTHAILSRLILIPNIGLANIVAGEEVAPEFIQSRANEQLIGDEIARLLDDDDYHAGRTAGLAQVRQKLGPSGGARRVAQMALELIDHGQLSDSDLQEA